MRIFQTQSMWDAKEGRWYEVFSVDGEQVSGEEYFRELETEQCLEDDEIDELEGYCQCCNCEDKCDEFECTCQLEDEEVEYIDENYECEDNELEEQCECPICQAEQEVKELDCFCEECSEDYIKEFIDECLEHVFNGCQECAIESVVKLAFKCKELGIESVKYKMYEFLED